MPTGFPIRRRESEGFRPVIRDCSLCAINWMDWINKYQNKHISHRYNTGGHEKGLANLHFDGYNSAEGWVGYDFLGCHYHGHIICNKICCLTKKMDPVLAKEIYERTIAREKYIKSHCKFVTIWECSYYNLAKVDRNLRNVINQSCPGFHKTHKGYVTPTQILTSVKKVKEVFKSYADLIMKYRREALSDPDKIPIVQMYNILGNAAYGSLLMNKFKFHDIRYVQGEEKAVQMVNNKNVFKKMG